MYTDRKWPSTSGMSEQECTPLGEKNDENSDQESMNDYSLLADSKSSLNVKSMHCKRCGSTIIKDNVATLLVVPDRKVGRMVMSHITLEYV